METKKLFSLLGALCIGFMFYGCGDDDEITPNPTEQEDPNKEEPNKDDPNKENKPYANFEIEYRCPNNIFELGDIIISYLDKNGEETKKTLKKSDFAEDTSNKDYIKYSQSLCYEHHGIEQTILIWFQPKVSSYTFTSLPHFRIETNNDSFESPYMIVSPSVTGIYIGSEPQNADRYLIAGYKFTIDDEGKITAKQLSEDDLRERLNDQQYDYLSKSVKSMIAKAYNEIDNILATPDKEYTYSERLPKSLFDKELDIAFVLNPGDDIIMIGYWIKESSENKWHESYTFESKSEIKNKLLSSDFIQRMTDRFEEKIVEMMRDK